MKALLLVFFFPLYSLAQFSQNTRLPVKATIVTDSGKVKGFLVHDSDSTIVISPTKRFDVNATVNIPVNTIRELKFKNKDETGVFVASGVFVLGFIVTAGLTKNGGDFNDDGKTSFFELILTAIEGTTSSNRRRRRTVLIIGGAGGVATLTAFLFSNKSFSLSFPINNRNSFYKEKRKQANSNIHF